MANAARRFNYFYDRWAWASWGGLTLWAALDGNAVGAALLGILTGIRLVDAIDAHLNARQ